MATRVFTMLADDAAVEDVVVPARRAAAIAAERRHPHLRRHAQRRRHPQARSSSQGGRANPDRDAVLGRPEVVAAGQAGMVVGGPAGQLAANAGRCSMPIARRVFEAGTDPVAAAAIKIANNFVLGCAIEAMGEGFSLVRKYGVVPEVLYDVMTEGLFASLGLQGLRQDHCRGALSAGRPARDSRTEGRQPCACRRRSRRRAAAERQCLARPPGRRRRAWRRRARLGGDGHDQARASGLA